MIKQIKVWRAKCDKCGRVFIGEGEAFYFETRQGLVDVMSDEFNTEWVMRDGKHYCGDCRYKED